MNIDKLLEEFLRKDWIDDQDWWEMLETLYNYIPKDKFIEDLNKGVENGYSVKQQLELLKNIFN